jgi:hypothetical protein
MEEQTQSDPDPAPLKHSDAERVTGEEADRGEEREPAGAEDDQARPEGETGAA